MQDSVLNDIKATARQSAEYSCRHGRRTSIFSWCLVLAICFCFLMPTVAFGVYTDQMMLSLTAEGTDSYALRFRMFSNVQGTQMVQYIPAQYQQTQDAQYLKTATVNRQAITGEAFDIGNATLTELIPKTNYVYRIGTEGDWGSWHSFSVPAAETTAFSFLYMSNIQAVPEIGSYIGWGSLLSEALADFKPAFGMFGGDTVNNGSDMAEWAKFFEAANERFDSLPIMLTPGNHDNTNMYATMFNLPQNGPDNFKELMYSFNYGNAHFIVLDSNSLGNTNNNAKFTAWLEADLKAAAQQTWKIVMFHHPAYAITSNAKDETRAQTIRSVYLPIFEQNGVDLLLCGHQHVYSHTYPMKAGQVVNHREGGIVQLMTVSGPKHYSAENYEYIECSKPAQSLFTEIAINGNTISIIAKDANGKLIDQYGWNKGASAADETRLLSADGAKDVISVNAAGVYTIETPLNKLTTAKKSITAILQLRYQNAGVIDKGAVYKIITKEIILSPIIDKVSFDFELPTGLADRFYADIFFWEDLQIPISVRNPVYGLTFQVNT